MADPIAPSDQPPQQLQTTEAQTPANRTPLAIGEGGIVPRTLDELWRLSTLIAGSDLAPKDYKGKPANCALAVEMGLEVGLRPMQAIQSIAVINGRPSIWGDAALALVEASGLLEDIEEVAAGEGDVEVATCTVKRRGRKPRTQRFGVSHAKRAGLWGKDGPWKNYPSRMLQMRARGFALRDAFPDVLKGIAIAEESIDITPPAPDAPPETPSTGSRTGDLAARLKNGTPPPPVEVPAGQDAGNGAEAKAEAAAAPQPEAPAAQDPEIRIPGCHCPDREADVHVEGCPAFKATMKPQGAKAEKPTAVGARDNLFGG